MRKVLTKVMSLSPKVLLSAVSRERCIANLKELPAIVTSKEEQPTTFASVLIPLCIENGEVCLLYTLRSTNLKNHSGQVSFPGGKMDENESVIETALRETEEEIGLHRDNVDIWTVMSPFQGRDKKIWITPVVGEIKNFDIKKLVRNQHEVEDIFTVPMSTFCNQANHGHYMHQRVPLPVYMCKYTIWGITGLITHLFLRNFLPKDAYQVDFMRKKFTVDDLMPSKL